jgi:hypothetical protein
MESDELSTLYMFTVGKYTVLSRHLRGIYWARVEVRFGGLVGVWSDFG